jgi:Reverse transcriptase (RNA-dependent DNA polymerase).
VSRAGKEFCELEGKIIIVKRALYGLLSLAERFHTHLADTFHTFGFKQTRFDSDVWIRLDQKEKMYEYICTHVDDFVIVLKNPDAVIKQIESVYLVKDDSKGPPDYFLGNDYKGIIKECGALDVRNI